MLLIALIGGIALAVSRGCGAEAPDGEGRQPTADGPLRIVSLSPAISRTLIDFGLERHIVGRTPFCDSLDRNIPVVGDLLDLDMEQMVRVRPTHVLVQPSAAGAAPGLVRLANERGWTLAAWHLDGVDDVRRLVRELPEALFDEGEEFAAIEATAAEIIRAIDDALIADVDAYEGRVLLVFGLEPVTVFGEGTYLHDMLVALGGVNAVSLRGYPQLTLEDVQRLDPDAIVLVRPGAAPGEGVSGRALGPLVRIDGAALRDGRLAVLAHPDALLPSSALAAVAMELRTILREFAHAAEVSP